MTVPRLWYANVFVRDIERALEFYAKTLGWPVRTNEAAHGYVGFDLGGASLGVAKIDPNDPHQAALVGRHTGVGLGVPDLDATYAELSSRGVRFTMPPTKQPWGGYMSLMSDPEGNLYYLDQLREH